MATQELSTEILAQQISERVAKIIIVKLMGKSRRHSALDKFQCNIAFSKRKGEMSEEDRYI